MKTEEELNIDIIKITALINDKFPELVKYVDEMPVKIAYAKGDDQDPNVKSLEDYYRSLETLVKKYSDNEPK